MSLKILENRYKYLQEKEKIIRETYDTKPTYEEIYAAPERVKGRYIETQRALNIKGDNMRTTCSVIYEIDGCTENDANPIAHAAESSRKQLERMNKVLLMAMSRANIQTLNKLNYLKQK